ncbi:hypothetical protein LY78DRAFT_734468 [Colletotrichum sublineola]|nr:hypothetical protein LY78DRAFT_734468 [Colletotrichum sublineola]
MASGRKKKQSNEHEETSQIWFFLCEAMSLTTFSQGNYTLEEVKHMDLTLDLCLKLSKAKGKVNDYSFWIHSDSMAAAVQLLSDQSIIAMYSLYCKNDPIVTIIIRGANDPSPNTSRTPSHVNSLASRRTVSAQRGILAPELFIHPRIRHASGSTDFETMEKIEDERAMISFIVDEEVLTFTKDYLLGWIDSQLADMKHPTEITVHSLGEDGRNHEVKLTSHVWEKFLLRGQWKEGLQAVWDKSVRAQSEREEMLANIANASPNFVQACQQYIYDLRNFGNNKGSRTRLEGTGHKFYMGQPYFDNATRDKLLQLPTQSGTLEGVLGALEKKRLDSSICASHDLFPIFKSVLGAQ